MQENIEKKKLGMKNHFDISGSIEIREVKIAGVACIVKYAEKWGGGGGQWGEVRGL